MCIFRSAEINLKSSARKKFIYEKHVHHSVKHVNLNENKKYICLLFDNGIEWFTDRIVVCFPLPDSASETNECTNIGGKNGYSSLSTSE